MRMLYQASVFVHDNEFDALRQKALRYLREAEGKSMRHGLLLKRMHIDADSFRRVIGTLVETETIAVREGQKNSLAYTLIE